MLGTDPGELEGTRFIDFVHKDDKTRVLSFLTSAGDGENTVAGRVDNVEYSGRDALLDVVTASGTLLHVRGAVTIRRGDQVRVRVPVERTLVYPLD